MRDTGPCERVHATLTVDRVTGSDLLVGNGSLVLHAASSAVWVSQSGACTVASPSDVHAGDRVGHDATQIATSYPGQAWPKTIVVER